MSTRGDVFINPVTGECAVVRRGTDDTPDRSIVVDLYVRPGGAVVGEHAHPAIEERFTVLRGVIGFRIGGAERTAPVGEELVVPARTPQDWWNAGTEEALVRVEIRPGDRFEAMIRNLFGLAQDGRTDGRGMPSLLQTALFAQEFADVIAFTRPPRLVQRLLFGALAPIARARGYRGSYAEYLNRLPARTAVPEDLTDVSYALPR